MTRFPANGIPNLLHFIWLQGEKNIPQEDQEFVEKWRKLHPDYGVIVWDRDMIRQFIVSCFSEEEKYIRAWDWMDRQEKPVFAKMADFARLLILWHFGGVYLDTDLEPLRRIDLLFSEPGVRHSKVRGARQIPRNGPLSKKVWEEQEFIISADNFSVRGGGSTVTNCCLIARPKLKLVKDMVDFCLKRIQYNTLESFGTWALTDFLRENIADYRETVTVLPPFYFNWNPRELAQEPHPWVFSVHHNRMRWTDKRLEKPWLA